MFLLCKLLVSPLLIKSRKMLIEFLTSNLNTEDATNSINDDKFMMAPRKTLNYQQIMRTPENPQKSKSKKKSSSFEQYFMRQISFDSPTNLNGNYQWENYPDLAEKKENKDSTTLAEVDLEVFAKHRTSVNEGAKIMRTEEGAFHMSTRRFCHMHKFSYAKKCERPKCDRYIFPQNQLRLK